MKDQMTTHLVWFNKDGVPQYELSKELQNLREAENLLISIVSEYIPFCKIFLRVNWVTMVMYLYVVFVKID
jgi:hypothetical protein